MKKVAIVALATLLGSAAQVDAQDWPMWGRDISNNMVSDCTGLPEDLDVGEFIGTSDELDLSNARNVRWVGKLGSQSYGNVTVADGRVYVGTNNDTPRDERFLGDRSCVYCFRESDGEFLWQLNVPKLGAGKVSDWEFLGICSSVCVDGEKAYIITNQCDIVCMDVHGLANGNQGFQGEAQYIAGRGKEPRELSPIDADILWVLNMTDECGVSPHNVTSSSPLVIGDRVWAATSNGVDYGHLDMPNPNAPALICVDKNTGELLAEEQIGLGTRTMHCGWSSPAYLKTPDLELCIFGGPDGRCYGFGPEFDEDEDGYSVLREIWRCDVNLPQYREQDGKPVKYATRGGPSEIISSPVVYDGLVYTLIGQDPEHGEGVGNLVCLDPSKTGGHLRNRSRLELRGRPPDDLDSLHPRWPALRRRLLRVHLLPGCQGRNAPLAP